MGRANALPLIGQVELPWWVRVLPLWLQGMGCSCQHSERLLWLLQWPALKGTTIAAGGRVLLARVRTGHSGLVLGQTTDYCGFSSGVHQAGTQRGYCGCSSRLKPVLGLAAVTTGVRQTRWSVAGVLWLLLDREEKWFLPQSHKTLSRILLEFEVKIPSRVYTTGLGSRLSTGLGLRWGNSGGQEGGVVQSP